MLKQIIHHSVTCTSYCVYISVYVVCKHMYLHCAQKTKMSLMIGVHALFIVWKNFYKVLTDLD